MTLFKLGISPNELKLADGTPVYKKEDPLNKGYYSHVSVSLRVSKMFKEIVYEHINSYREPWFSHLLCGFRKNHNNQHLLLKMLESLKNRNWFYMKNVI